MKRFATMLLGALAVALTMTGCGGGNDSGGAAALAPELETLSAIQSVPRTTFVGKVDGTDAYIAVVDRGGKITAYACDKGATALWFTGTKQGNAIKATNPKGATLDAVQADAVVTGTVVLDGGSHAFSAERATYPAGLWQGIDDASVDLAKASRYGWVVLPDGSQRGAKSGNVVAAVSAVSPASGTGGGVVASPNPAPPVTTTGDLTQAQCDSLLEQGQIFWAAYDNAKDDAQKARILVRVDLTAQRFGDGGCTGGFYSQL